MHIHTLLSFIPVALLLLAFAPGPDNLGVLALGVSHGRRESLGFAIGCAAGCPEPHAARRTRDLGTDRHVPARLSRSPVQRRGLSRLDGLSGPAQPG